MQTLAYLVKVSQPQLVILLVELEEESVEALCRMVNRARIRRVQDLFLAISREDDIDVSLRNFTPAVAIPVDPHGAKMHQMDVETTFNNAA